MTVSIPPEVIEAAAAKAVAAHLASLGGVETVRLLLVPTRHAAAAFDMKRDKFLSLMAAHGIEPVTLGPRMTRWRYTDLVELIDRK
jgi:hypothetical protein